MRIFDLTARVRRTRRSSCVTAPTKQFGVVALTDDIDRACIGASRLVPLIQLSAAAQPVFSARPSSSIG
jgi:hypothetical protein